MEIVTNDFQAKIHCVLWPRVTKTNFFSRRQDDKHTKHLSSMFVQRNGCLGFDAARFCSISIAYNKIGCLGILD